MTGKIRTLTILFTDIVRSTELRARLGEDEAERMRSRHYSDLREQIERFHGSIVKTLGDGVMASFEAAGDAIDCAVASQQATRSAAADARRTVAIRIGISSGDVRAEAGDYHGMAVVQASRLCSEAAAGQVLLADATRVLAGAREGLEPYGELELKGLPEPLRSWEATWTSEVDTKIRVVLADDAVLVREGIAHVLEAAGIEVIGQAGDGDELMRLVADLRPDVAIVDVRMPPTHTTEGLEAAEALRREVPDVGVLVLSQEVEPASAARLLAISQTSVGYLLKERVSNLREFADAVKRVAAGGNAFESSVISSVLNRSYGNRDIRELSEDESTALREVIM